MKIGQIYKVKTAEGLPPAIGKLQGVARCITAGTLGRGVRHFVELSFKNVYEGDSFHIKVPFEEFLKEDDSRVEGIVNAIVGGTQVPKAESRDLSGPVGAP